uniref:Uncharacterized protein n=1 Tax=Aquisalinus luteolus TaxID=1566827 RepID=A0A8J3A107_9PROT|nr:hypothetical protein GCM10011355_00420 [Aquisalinus luteolus]
MVLMFAMLLEMTSTRICCAAMPVAAIFSEFMKASCLYCRYVLYPSLVCGSIDPYALFASAILAACCLFAYQP